MSITLKRKVETGIVAFLKQVSELDQYHAYEASEMKARRFPGFVVKASGEKEVFPGGSPRTIQLEIAIFTECHDNPENEVPSDETRLRVRAAHDKALAALEAALEAPGSVENLQEFLNYRETRRPVDDFHFYDITKTGEDPFPMEGCFADSIAFDVVCQNCDGPPPLTTFTFADTTPVFGSSTLRFA